jgi:hypothetical protein
MAGLGETIQGLVIQEFIHDHARQETHIGTAVIQNTLGGRSDPNTRL